MKLAVLFHDDIIESGASQSMFTLVEKWHHDGVDIIAFIPGYGTLREKLNELGIQTYYLPSVISRYNLGRNVIRQFLVRFFGMLSFIKFKLIHSSKIVDILNNESVDIIYANTTTCIQGYFLAKRTKKNLVWHVREFGDLDQNCGFVGKQSYFYKMLDSATLIVFISKAIENHYINHLRKARCVVIYNDLSKKYEQFEKKNWAKRPLTILSCGSLNPGKGHLDVIKAVALLKRKNIEVELNIAGCGDMYLPLYYNLIRDENVENIVHLLGQVKEMNQLRRRCEIGVVASKMEAFGRVTVEGMLSGMLMIGADSGGTAEIIEDHKTGLLFQQGNPNAIADKIEEVVQDNSLAERMAINGYNSALRYINGNCANSIMKELEYIVNGK